MSARENLGATPTLFDKSDAQRPRLTAERENDPQTSSGPNGKKARGRSIE
jgi:hypothetical protein